ncbi:hypothetical protein SRIMM317S_06068 [Streptomyces rimosus subsp. rimosus]
MIGNNSCGSHSVAWGTTADSVRELEVLSTGASGCAPGAARRLWTRSRPGCGTAYESW